MDLELTAHDVKKKIDNQEDFILLDVRTDREYHFAHIHGSLHIPLDKLGEGSLGLEKGKEIITYCHHGVRSLKAAHILQEHGYEKVKSMSGGIHEWSVSIDPEIPVY